MESGQYLTTAGLLRSGSEGDSPGDNGIGGRLPPPDDNDQPNQARLHRERQIVGLAFRGEKSHSRDHVDSGATVGHGVIFGCASGVSRRGRSSRLWDLRA